ncbi:MAG TPA: SGNH/GDSL hydrolase family protein [Pyrinomonadaceae bacterium]|nr:SGNH/GDSL hydrolase family protein [Pyrinomonadaceae bacterium]
MASGRSAAGEVIAFREKQRRKRAALEKKLPARRRGLGAATRVPTKARGLFGTRKTVGVLIAEGDSWFDYPMQDVLRLLEDDYLYDVESVAHKGDNVEDMAHSKGQFEEFARRLEKLLRDGKVPRAILLSGGGNDIAGDEFVILLNHAASTLPPLNEDIVRGVIDVRLKEAYARILSGLTAIAKSYLGRPLPIITHGYDYPVPDGRGFLGGWWKLPGPWLKPAFQRKGHDNLAKNTSLIAQLIDRFNAMLAAVSALPEFAHVHYLDLRGTLKHDGTYKQHWANEMHPSATGFDLVTEKFANTLEKL